MVKLDEMDDLDKQLEEVLNKIDSDTKKEIEKGDIKEKAEEVKEINKEQIVEDANSASEAVVEGFGNINQMNYDFTQKDVMMEDLNCPTPAGVFSFRSGQNEPILDILTNTSRIEN